jgi:hypothetical protein
VADRPVEPDEPAVTFDSEHRFSVLLTLVSLLGELSDGWASGVWTVWAETPDGKRFELRRFDDQGSARQTIEAYQGQLRLTGPVEWAASKGFTDLAAHLAGS